MDFCWKQICWKETFKSKFQWKEPAKRRKLWDPLWVPVGDWNYYVILFFWTLGELRFVCWSTVWSFALSTFKVSYHLSQGSCW